jgi:DNA-binding transcriptional ArsR family regulator
MKKIAALDGLSALAQETRLDVFRLLIQAGADGLAAGDIARKLATRQNTLSSHLNILVGAGLIRRVREGRSIRYRVDHAQMRALLVFLLENCCRGDAAICGPLLDAVAC